MNINFKSFSFAMLVVFGTLSGGAVVAPHSKTIVVETPETHAVLLQANPEAMCLHDTNDGRTLLYIETANGKKLTSLDVTDPSKIQRFAESEIPAKSAYEFMRALSDSSVLIRYRDGSGVALISFKHLKHPELASSPALVNAEAFEPLGPTAILVGPTEAPRSFVHSTSYRVIDISKPNAPAVLADIPEVQQSLSKSDTGTLFLLNKVGVSVVRQLQVEVEHQIELDQKRGN